MSFAQKPNTINPNETIKDILENFHFYGRLCVQSVTAFNGYSAIQNGASDLGFKGESNISKGIIMFANLEVGVNMVDNNNKILIKDDPGYAVGEENNAVSSRLGFIGIKTKYGSFTWGKQWAPYYDIGGFTDRLYEFGGDAQGTYPNGTDGGISGTGRAGNSLQYRNRVGPLKLAFQIQNRHNFNNQENNKKFADTFGASLVCETNSKISFGVAFNKVCDGIVKPDINQPKKGDEAVIAGIMFQNSNLTIGSIYSVFSNHATDNLGNYFSGYGYELALTYNFQNNFEVEFGFNYKEPYGSNNGLYKIEYFVGGLSYHFKKLSMVFAELKFDRSRQFDGTYMQSIIGFGAQLGF
jgi:outer membrane protein N